ncbi:MAG: hypothetical protein V4675_19835 [Verrucomicrobiota bacterium]
MLIGGFAAIAHGSSLQTRDVDVCIRFGERNLRRIQMAFEGLHPVHRARPDLPLDLTPELCARLKNLYLKTDIGIVDCLGELIGVGGYEEALRHSFPFEFPFGTCRLLDLDTLIKSKEAMGRPHDLLTVEHLKAVKSQLRGGQ